MAPRLLFLRAVAVLLLSAAAAPLADAFPEAWEVTEAYAGPWAVKSDILMLSVLPLAGGAPSPQPGWNLTLVDLGYQAGPGIMTIALYKDTPVTPSYSELIYSPGQFKPCGAGGETYSSAARIWVDNDRALRAGRSVWGTPKQLARFDWRWARDGGIAGVTVTDVATDHVIVEVSNFDVAPLSPLSLFEPLTGPLLPRALPCVHWPIADAGVASGADVPAYRTSEAARAASPMRPLAAVIDLPDLTRATVVKAAFPPPRADALLLTGRADEHVVVLPVGVRVSGDMATLNQPRVLEC